MVVRRGSLVLGRGWSGWPLKVRPFMRSMSLLRLAILGEGLLVFIALGWGRWRGISFVFVPGANGSGGTGGMAEALLVGCLAAAVLGGANYYLLCGAPNLPGVRSIRRLYVEGLKPVFGNLSAMEIIAISVAAGVGEEMLFRGVLQPELGLVPASVIFGLLHMGDSGTLVFGCWVMIMGAALGALAIWSGGLLAPIVAHAVYDAAAMSYIRWGRGPRA